MSKFLPSFNKVTLLLRARAPLWLMWSRARVKFQAAASGEKRRYRDERNAFRALSKTYQFDDDWFTSNIPTWLHAFAQTDVQRDSPLKYLEIGSWQGRSTLFVAETLPNAHLTCVDTWEGADEHKSLHAVDAETLSTVEAVFDRNLDAHKGRITKVKATSYAYFQAHFEPNIFDIVYVDGSHHADDVIVDAAKSFEMLRVGGLMIFDDYFGGYYAQPLDNPAGAINAFLRLKQHQLEVVSFDYQLVVKKTKASERWTE